MRVTLALAAMLLPATAHAQAYQCSVPARIERPHPEVASDDQPQRLLPVGGYTLALTWAPQFCRSARQADSFECGRGQRFGFTLHGLWPDGVGKDWPQYCRSTALLPPTVLRRNLCATPSAQLMQHEWAKHGTCMAGLTPQRYFARSTGLYARLRYPEMDSLSRGPLTAGQFATALAAANPGLPASAVRVPATRAGWGAARWLCLAQRFRYTRCRADSGGIAPDARLLIWRGRR